MLKYLHCVFTYGNKNVKSVNLGIVKFSTKLYHILTEEHQNLVSPFWISAVMAILSNGNSESDQESC